jgi:hypothetical protein
MIGALFSPPRIRQYLVPFLLCAGAFPCQVYAESGNTPNYLQVTLSSPIDSAHAKLGQSVEAKAAFDWESPTCILRKGTHLRGHVVDVQKASKTLKDSHVAFSIDQADCQGHPASPLKLEVVEIIGSSPDDPAWLLHIIPFGGGGESKTSLNGPPTVHPGEVQGLKGVTLHLGGGPNGSTLLTASGQNLYLTTYTVLILSLDNLAPVEFKLQMKDQ